MGQSVLDKRNYKFLIFVSITVLGAIPVAKNGNASALDLYFLLVSTQSVPLAWSNKYLKRIITVSAIWFILQLISNLIFKTKIFGVPGLMGLQVAVYSCGIFWLHRNKNMSLIEITTALILGYALLIPQTGLLSSSNYWKYGYSVVLSSLFLTYLAQLTEKKFIFVIALLFLVVINYSFGNRNGLGVCLLTLFLVIFSSKDLKVRKFSQNSLLFFVISIFILIFFTIYPKLVINGFFGSRAQVQYSQFTNNSYSLLLGGRPESVQSAYLIFKSPLLGYGSYGRPSGDKTDAALDFIDKNVIKLDANSIRYLRQSDGLVVGYSTHSQIGSSVLFGGVGVLLFWFFFLYGAFQNLKILFSRHERLGTMMIFFTLATVWDVFFSPLGQSAKLELSLCIFFCVVNLDNLYLRNLDASKVHVT